MQNADPILEIEQKNQLVEPVKIWKARQWIEENAAEKISLTQVADLLGMSPTHLSEKFKEVTGINFVEYVARKRFERAAGLLRDVNLRISEIAFAVGFQSLSQFNRVFKKLAGTSPTAYRQSAEAEKAATKFCPKKCVAGNGTA